MKYAPRFRAPWRQAEPWKDDTALTARELLPAIVVWLLCLVAIVIILPILFMAPTPVTP